MTNNLLADTLSEPLDGATEATIDIDSGIGHLKIDSLVEGDQALATGTLQYFEKQGVPSRSLGSDHGRAILTVRGRERGRPWFQAPWLACSGGTEWQIHLNPTVASDITARTGGGNVQLDLSDMVVSHLVADSGGGNLDVVLPDRAANLAVAARTGGGNVNVEIGDGTTGSNSVEAISGAGNVVVRVPSGLSVRVRATSGLGKVAVEPQFTRVNATTYQSPAYDDATDKVEITLKSGAGNVIVSTK